MFLDIRSKVTICTKFEYDIMILSGKLHIKNAYYIWMINTSKNINFWIKSLLICVIESTLWNHFDGYFLSWFISSFMYGGIRPTSNLLYKDVFPHLLQMCCCIFCYCLSPWQSSFTLFSLNLIHCLFEGAILSLMWFFLL